MAYRVELLQKQTDSIRIPPQIMYIPRNASMKSMKARMNTTLAKLKPMETHLFWRYLEDLRNIEGKISNNGYTGLFPVIN
jgi:hypothetical protein